MKIVFIYLVGFILLINLSCNENAVQAEEQFIQIQLKYNYNDELNTFEHYLTKDLVLDGQVTIEFWLTEEEQIQIENKVYELGFFSLPDTLVNNSQVIITPNPIQYLKIKIANQQNTVVWNFITEEYQTDQYKRLRELARFIIDKIQAKPEYKSLPPSRGGYI